MRIIDLTDILEESAKLFVFFGFLWGGFRGIDAVVAQESQNVGVKHATFITFSGMKKNEVCGLRPAPVNTHQISKRAGPQIESAQLRQSSSDTRILASFCGHKGVPNAKGTDTLKILKRGRIFVLPQELADTSRSIIRVLPSYEDRENSERLKLGIGAVEVGDVFGVNSVLHGRRISEKRACVKNFLLHPSFLEPIIPSDSLP
jgi:hypothetical protein